MYNDLDPVLKNELETVIENNIRPALFAHGGDLEILDFADGVLRFKFIGKCSGCPAADLTSEEIVKTELCERLPFVKDAVLVQSTSDELIEEARRILNLRKNNQDTE